MNIKAVFFDIDGTLVSFKNHKMPASTKEALWQLHNNGIKIFIATGRFKDGLEVLGDIPFDGYITLNGQYCYTNKEVVYENFIEKEDLASLLEVLDEQPFPCGFTMKTGKIYNYKDKRVAEIHSITHNDDQPTGDLSRVLDEKVYQLMCFVSKQEEEKLLEKMPHCTSARWHPLFTDVTPLGGTKQLGIDKFLSYYNIDRQETMAFGDGGNDLQMLNHVAHGIAMGNGEERLKQIAEYVCDDVDHDGIVETLRHYELIK